MPVRPECIPASLRRLRRWVVWRWEWKPKKNGGEGGWDKPPKQTDGRDAKSNYPSTWTTFEEALAAHQNGRFDGVGVMLGQVDDSGPSLVGIDLDRVRDPVTGKVKPWAAWVATRLESYAEVSPSGTGIKLLAWGTLPQGRYADHERGVEMYHRSRYFCLTGHRLPETPDEVMQRGEVLTQLHAELLAEPSGESADSRGRSDRDDRELALDALRGLKTTRAAAYDSWLGVGMSLHSVDESSSMLAEWDRWSQCCPDAYEEGACRRKWSSFGRGAITLGSLLFWARQDGWTPPRREQNRQHTAGPSSNGKPHAEPKAPTIVRTLAPFVPFPVSALPSPVDQFVSETATAIGCDPSFVALPALAVLASAIGNSRTVRLKRGWDEVSVLWVSIIGDSGSLKSPAFTRALSPIYRVQRELLAEYRTALADYQTKLEQHKEAKKLFKENKGPDPGAPPTAPVHRRAFVSDITIERLAEVLEDNPKGTLAARDELSGWLGSFSRYKAAQGGSDVPNWLEMFRSGPIQYDRKTGERRTVFVPRAAVSVCGGIQPTTLARALTPEHLDCGLAARLLLAMPPRLEKRWSDLEVHPNTEDAYDKLVDKLLALKMHTSGNDLLPVVLPLSREAKQRWIEHYNRFAVEQAQAEGEIAAALSKLEGYSARLALLHHCVRQVSLGTDATSPLSQSSMESGIALAGWFTYEARRIYSMLAETEEETATRRLVEYIRSREGQITIRDLQRANSRKYPTAAHAQEALEALATAGLGCWAELERNTDRGRPPGARFVLHPTPDNTEETCDEEDADEGDADEGVSDKTS
jgi:hypothetical protein